MKGCTEAVKYLFSLCIFVSFVSCVSAKEHLKEASISAGIMQKSNMQTKVVKETDQIPFITKNEDPRYGFGYRIEFASDEPYVHKAIIRVPIGTRLTGNVPAVINETDPYRIVSYPAESVSEYYHLFMRLSDDDPLGKYIVETYLNGELFKVTEFNVVDMEE